MLSNFSRHLRRFFRRYRGRELAPDEIFLDSRNLPKFNTHQCEGRLEKPISRGALQILGFFFILIGVVFSSKAWLLQIARGAVYEELAVRNSLRTTPLFAERGVVYDRNDVELVWNVPSEDGAFAVRRYKEEPGFAHILGYVNYPSKDSAGFYYREDFIGTDGIEKTFQSRCGKSKDRQFFRKIAQAFRRQARRQAPRLEKSDCYFEKRPGNKNRAGDSLKFYAHKKF